MVRGGGGVLEERCLHTGQGLTKVGAYEVVVGSRGPGAAEGFSGLGVEHVLLALRAGGDIQGPGQPGEG